MPSADTETTDDDQAEIVDEARNALLEAVSAELGDAVVETHLMPGRDLWIRVDNNSWAETADYLHNRQRFRFFGWLSAIDWMPSPFGRSHDAEVDKQLGATGVKDDAEEADPAAATGAQGFAGGSTRFQVLARVHNLTTNLGLTVKTDLGPDLSVATWTEHYPGADWHEREAWEMFGVDFVGHPGLRKLYLPGDFEGHPMRKDFPLVARLVKPWPGIVDVEPMPEAAESADGPTETNPEASS